MREKIHKIMVQGGYAVIIAVVAMSAYLTAMYFANKYFEKITQPAKLAVDSDGYVFIDGFEPGEEEIIYVMWETDGGNIHAVEKDGVFDDQENNPYSKGYYANTTLDGKIEWNSQDADGNVYSVATVRAIIYRYNKSDNENPYYMGDYVNELTITLADDNGKVVKNSEDRYFSNPVRKDGDGEWCQIYAIETTEKTTTYRYRTGKNIDDSMMALCWETDEPFLYETNIEAGFYPKSTIAEGDASKFLITKNVITVNNEDIKGKTISAYLVDEETYEDYDTNNTKIDDSKKSNIAQISVYEIID